MRAKQSNSSLSSSQSLGHRAKQWIGHRAKQSSSHLKKLNWSSHSVVVVVVALIVFIVRERQQREREVTGGEKGITRIRARVFIFGVLSFGGGTGEVVLVRIFSDQTQSASPKTDQN